MRLDILTQVYTSAHIKTLLWDDLRLTGVEEAMHLQLSDRVIMVRGGFVRTVCLQNYYNNHNNHHLPSSVMYQALCQDFDHS